MSRAGRRFTKRRPAPVAAHVPGQRATSVRAARRTLRPRASSRRVTRRSASLRRHADIATSAADRSQDELRKLIRTRISTCVHRLSDDGCGHNRQDTEAKSPYSTSEHDCSYWHCTAPTHSIQNITTVLAPYYLFRDRRSAIQPRDMNRTRARAGYHSTNRDRVGAGRTREARDLEHGGTGAPPGLPGNDGCTCPTTARGASGGAQASNGGDGATGTAAAGLGGSPNSEGGGGGGVGRIWLRYPANNPPQINGSISPTPSEDPALQARSSATSSATSMWRPPRFTRARISR